MRIAESRAGEIEAAIFASDCASAAPRKLPSADVERAASVARQTLMINGLAVTRGRRRRGLGHVLVREVLDAGRATDVSVVRVAYDDIVPGLDYFWGRMGFTPLEDSMRLIYSQYPGQAVEFPTIAPVLRWGYQILRPTRVVAVD